MELATILPIGWLGVLEHMLPVFGAIAYLIFTAVRGKRVTS